MREDVEIDVMITFHWEKEYERTRKYSTDTLCLVSFENECLEIKQEVSETFLLCVLDPPSYILTILSNSVDPVDGVTSGVVYVSEKVYYEFFISSISFFFCVYTDVVLFPNYVFTPYIRFHSLY